MAFISVLLQIFWKKKKKKIQKCFWSSPLPTIWILSKSLILTGCHGNRRLNFRKQYSKIFFSEAIMGMKLKLCINVHNISVYINYVFIVVAHVLSLLWFPYNGKNWNWHLFLCYCRYFDKSFSEMFLENSFTNHVNFVQITDFNWWPWQPKG